MPNPLNTGGKGSGDDVRKSQRKGRFVEIEDETVQQDATLRAFLQHARATISKRGDGVFISASPYVDTSLLRRYGISVPGALIVPASSGDVDGEIKRVRSVIESITRSVNEEENARREKAQIIRTAAEQAVEQDRARLLDKVQSVYDLLTANAGPGWWMQALEYGKQEPCSLYNAKKVNAFALAHRIGLMKPLVQKDAVFEWTDGDVEQLTDIVRRWVDATKPRRDFLWNLFKEANGIFTKTETPHSDYAGRSFLDGKARHDQWLEVEYFIGNEKVTDPEYGWLKSRSNELSAQEGYVRVNDTNDLMPILDMPGRNDVLVIVGKTGSHRGVWSYGELFRGHPSKCTVSLGTTRASREKIQSVTLNGVARSGNWVDLDRWTNPYELAKRAILEAGLKYSPEYAEALAEVYRRQLKK